MTACPVVKFIYDLPYKARSDLGHILDYNNDWKVLGGTYMNLNCYELFQMEGAIIRRGSPTEELLSRCGARNVTVLELFKNLHSMKHYRAMLVLKPYVDPKYHKCIPDGCNEKQTVKAQNEERKERCVFSEDNIKTAQPIVRVNLPETSVRQNNQPTRKVSDPVTPMNVLGGTPHISYEELTHATNNWDKLNILGKGGFGTVYKGFWKNTPIAVKKLEIQRSNKSEETLNQCQREQSMRELKYLNSCRHDNILPLYGISFESGKYCLVYQFMPNGSLEDRLLMRKNTAALMWTERLNIAKGTALGLQFLHSREPPLIHGDIKSANILLNAHMDPVIGDFGLTQEGPIEKATHITLKRVNGTRPYLPHEFLSAKRLSTKVDVYGFGIVLFELATGMRAYDDTRRSERQLKSLVEKYSEENMFDLVDKNAQPLELNIAYTFIKIGKISTKFVPNERPEMIQVFNLLCGSAPSSVESSNATGPRPTLALSSATPVRTMSPSNLPRFKFGGGGKGPDSGIPYLPAPIQILNFPHLQQTGSLVESPRFPLQQHLATNLMRPQQTASQKMQQDMLPRPQVPQSQFVRSGPPNEIHPPSMVKEQSVSQQQQYQQPPLHCRTSPSPVLNITTSLGPPLSIIPPGALVPSIMTSPAPVLPNTMRLPTPAFLINKVIPEASQSQDEESREYSSGSCNHSTSESDTSVEILNKTSDQPLLIQDRTDPPLLIQDRKSSELTLALAAQDSKKSEFPLAAQEKKNAELPPGVLDKKSVGQDRENSNVPVQDIPIAPDNNRTVDIVPADSMPLLQLLNMKR